jgi:hypothetical protein
VTTSLFPSSIGACDVEYLVVSSYWSWIRLLGRVCALDMATCPLCRRGSLRLMAAITHEAVIPRLLRHGRLASVPLPLAPARARQATFDGVASAHDIARGLVGDVRAAEV